MFIIKIMPKKSNSHGFTLLEILLVVGIIAILAGIVIVAINPSRQLAQVRNTERKSDIKQINSAVMQFYIDKGYFPDTITAASTEICATGEMSTSSVPGDLCGDLVDLSVLVPVYLTAIPVDPQGAEETSVGLEKFISKVYAATNGTNYWIKRSATGKIIETTAGGAELGTVISIPASISDSGGDTDFVCGDSLIYEGGPYPTVEIGDQCWTQKNMNVGVMVGGTTEQTNNSIIEKYCYGNSSSNCEIYGGLYQWDEAMQYSTSGGAKGICPVGWHIPTHFEFSDLEIFICNSLENTDCAATFPKDYTTTGWLGTNEGTLLKSESGPFMGQLAGLRSPSSGVFDRDGDNGYFWSSVQNGMSAWRHALSVDSAVFRNSPAKTYGYSVRCLKN